MLARKGCFLYHSGARIGLPTPHMSIFSLGKGEKEHEVFKCEYAGVEARKQDSNMWGGGSNPILVK